MQNHTEEPFKNEFDSWKNIFFLNKHYNFSIYEHVLALLTVRKLKVIYCFVFNVIKVHPFQITLRQKYGKSPFWQEIALFVQRLTSMFFEIFSSGGYPP